LTVTEPAGTFTVSGRDPAGDTWNFNAPVTAGGCILEELDAPLTGRVSFWTNCNNCGSETIAVNGVTVGTLTTYFTSQPQCGQAGTLTVTEPAGTSTVSARDPAGDTWNFNAPVTAGGCILEELDAPLTGRVSFWTNCSGCGGETIAVNGVTVGTLTTYFTSPPQCGQAGTLTVTEPAGTSTVSGRDPAGDTWNFNAPVTAGGCILEELDAPATGKISFWTNCSNCGSETIAVNGVTVGALTTYFTITPQCGQAGTLTVTEFPGSYVVSARDPAGATWNGVASVTAGSCFLEELPAH
jgi:succinate dehydrogenase/fumarate reductase-like Fe-S protein